MVRRCGALGVHEPVQSQYNGARLCLSSGPFEILGSGQNRDAGASADLVRRAMTKLLPESPEAWEYYRKREVPHSTGQQFRGS